MKRSTGQSMLFRPGAVASALCLIMTPLGKPAGAQDPAYALSFLPDEQANLICIDRGDAHNLLLAFREAYLGTEQDARVVMRGFEPDMGPDKAFDCGYVQSIYVPRLPIDVIDLEVTDGLGWDDKPLHFFVQVDLLVEGQKFSGATGGDGLYAFTWDFVINKF